MFKCRLSYLEPKVVPSDAEQSLRGRIWEVCHQMWLDGRFVISVNEHEARLDGASLAALILEIPELIDDVVADRDAEIESFTQGYVALLRFEPDDGQTFARLTVNEVQSEAVFEKAEVVSELIKGFQQLLDYLALDPALVRTRAYRHWLGVRALVDLGIAPEVLREEWDYGCLDWID